MYLSDHYGKSLLLAPDGTPLSVLPIRRRNWYLKKNLAVLEDAEPPYEEYLRLKFEPKCGKNNSAAFLQILENKCIVCGSNKKLSIHHVIPRAIRKHLSFAKKNHNHWWCVLLCSHHHKHIEHTNRKLWADDYNQFLKKDSFDLSVSAMLILYNLKYKSKTLHLVSPDRLQAYFNTTQYWKKEQDIVRSSQFYRRLKQIRKQRIERLQKQWADNFISFHGIEHIENMFRNSILAMKPEFLHDGFLYNHK